MALDDPPRHHGGRAGEPGEDTAPQRELPEPDAVRMLVVVD
ncbi:hypothetical protein [Streptomyces sp. NPDC092370]